MNTSKLSQGQMIAAGGGALLIISLFLSWESGFGVSASAFDAFSGMDIIMLIVGLAAVGYAAATAMDAASGLTASAPRILSLCGIALIGWTLGWDLEDPGAGFGAWLALIATIAIAYGGYEASGTAGAVRSAGVGGAGAGAGVPPTRPAPPAPPSAPPAPQSPPPSGPSEPPPA
jgi:hypothetical protein